jgi:hypothetical protein
MKFTFGKIVKFTILLILFYLILSNVFYVISKIIKFLTNNPRIIALAYTSFAIISVLLFLILFFYIFEVIQFQIKTVFILLFFINILAFAAIGVFFYFGQSLCAEIEESEQGLNAAEKMIFIFSMITYVILFFVRLNSYKLNFLDIIHYISLVCLVYFLDGNMPKFAVIATYAYFMMTRFNFKSEYIQNNKNYLILMMFITFTFILVDQIKYKQIESEFYMYIIILSALIYYHSPFYQNSYNLLK